MRDAGDVEPARRNVRGDQYLNAPFLEVAECALAVVVRLISVN